VVVCVASCSSLDSNNGFTGTFRLIEYPEQGQYRVQVFVLTQQGEQITGTYSKGETTPDVQWDCTYDVAGTVILTDSAELMLTLREANPSGVMSCESEPNLTLNVVLRTGGNMLYVSEWDMEFPRADE
jgi:hypothetical protein